jgi:dCMP deaminase
MESALPRPSFEVIYMELARTLSRRSICSRRNVGCVIVSNDYRRVLSVGYNGNAIGLPNRCDNPEASGSCGCLHAEENAVISCSEPTSTSKIIFTTVYPCKMCAKRIIQLGGVIKVYYMDDYRNIDAATILEQSGISVLNVHINARL